MNAAGRRPELTVVGYAMWTAAGHDGPSSVAAMRAAAAPSSRANLWDTRAGEELNAFRLTAHQWWEGASFLPHMIAPVIEDCRAWLRDAGEAEDAPVLIGVAPTDRPQRPPDLERIVLDGLDRLLEGGLPGGSTVAASGRAGMPHLLNRAKLTGAPFTIVLGAESFLQQAIIQHYNDASRLLSADNSNGFIAGEAAAAVIVAQGAVPGLVLSGMGVDTEASRAGGSREAPVTGDGLTGAMRAALEAAGRTYHEIDVLMGDLNGEHFKFKEHVIAAGRLDRLPADNRTRRPREHVEHWNLIETIGEVGAALTPAAMGWAFEAGRSGYLPGRVMFTAGEDDGRRAAIVGEWLNG